ncbi:hypothetical protein FEM48_Zijuj12G0073900 [Ziziphus jujuba var. spinosa]|uniref:Uncharacterized protein n=1 Tax=Ziziphus jujuba var. spinosa TaxID=714518 RepID=A0A978UBY7_ZIZJJ|nr:hypothetical protein FEM48_Zijuj12G0073900 [Ziziphus jujuba var. spinosa]
MSKPIILRSQSSNRRQPLLNNNSRGSSRNSRFAEVAGGTTASCAALCCCCPCGLVNLLVLAIYKLPAGLCRRALKKKRHDSMIKNGGVLPPRCRRCSYSYDEAELQIHPLSMDVLKNVKSPEWEEAEKQVMELEKEMWERIQRSLVYPI